MKKSVKKRLDHIEQKFGSFVAAKQRQRAERERWLHLQARDHAVKVAALIVHGEPGMHEPLEAAWARTLNRLRATNIPDCQLGDFLRAAVIDHLDGSDEVDKLSRIFESAPAWLLYFCTV